MSLKDALVVELRANAGVAAIVATRVFRGIAPQGQALPYLTLQLISNDHQDHMTAASGLADARIQVSSWDKTEHGAEALANAVREALDGFTQATLGGSGYTADVRRISLEGEAENYVAPMAGDDVGVFGVMQDYGIWYGETIPTFA